MVHARVRDLVPFPAARAGVRRRTHPTRWHQQPFPDRMLVELRLAWDPYNVTEDADLGIRLARLGYSVGVLDSITEEEANSDFVNWVKQRSRWYKGYLQTWLVHMRRPVAVHRELGWRGALGLHLFVLGTPLTTLMNPIFWALAIAWYLQEPNGVALLFPPAVYYLALACFVIGNAAVIYVNVLIARVMNRPGLLGAALLVPVYWVMMSVAAVKLLTSWCSSRRTGRRPHTV